MKYANGPNGHSLTNVVSTIAPCDKMNAKWTDGRGQHTAQQMSERS